MWLKWLMINVNNMINIIEIQLLTWLVNVIKMIDKMWLRGLKVLATHRHDIYSGMNAQY